MSDFGEVFYDRKFATLHEFKRCKHWLADALAHGNGTHTLDDVCHGVMSGSMMLLTTASGCVVLEVQQFPQKKVMNVFLGGGDLAAMKELARRTFEEAAKAGCADVTIHGRRGWGRVFKEAYGAGEVFCVYSAPVAQGV